MLINIYRSSFLLFILFFFSLSIIFAQNEDLSKNTDNTSDELEKVAEEQQNILTEANQSENEVESEEEIEIIAKKNFYIEGFLGLHSFSDKDNTRQKFVWVRDSFGKKLNDKELENAGGFGFAFGYNLNEQLSVGAEYQIFNAGNRGTEALLTYSNGRSEIVKFERTIDIQNFLVFAKYSYPLTLKASFFGKISIGYSTYGMSLFWDLVDTYKIDQQKQTQGNVFIISGGFSTFTKYNLAIPIEIAYVSVFGYGKINWDNTNASYRVWNGKDLDGNDFSGIPKANGVRVSLGLNYGFNL